MRFGVNTEEESIEAILEDGSYNGGNFSVSIVWSYA